MCFKAAINVPGSKKTPHSVAKWLLPSYTYCNSYEVPWETGKISHLLLSDQQFLFFDTVQFLTKFSFSKSSSGSGIWVWTPHYTTGSWTLWWANPGCLSGRTRIIKHHPRHRNFPGLCGAPYFTPYTHTWLCYIHMTVWPVVVCRIFNDDEKATRDSWNCGRKQVRHYNPFTVNMVPTERDSSCK